MSGLFKQLINVIPAKDFAVKSHNYLLYSAKSIFSPAAYYYDPSVRQTGLQQGHSHDIFELSAVSYALQRQTKSFSETLDKIEDEEKFAALKSEVENQIALNQNAQSSFNVEIIKMLEGKVPVGHMPISTAAEITYILANSEHQKAVDLVKSSVAPIIAQKIEYASTQNVIDIFVSLQKLGLLGEKQIVDSLLSKLATIKFPWEHQPCEYHAWETREYEIANKPKVDFSNEFDQQYKALQFGSELSWRYGLIKRLICREVQYRLTNRYMERESRVIHNFEPVNIKSEQADFKGALEELGKIPEYTDGHKKILNRLE